MIANYTTLPFHRPTFRKDKQYSQESSYSKSVDGTFRHIADARPVSREQLHKYSGFRSFVQASEFPCLGAKSAVNTENYRVGSYGKMASTEATSELARDLALFIDDTDLTGEYRTFAAIFSGDIYHEAAFETALWAQLEMLTAIDKRTYSWDSTVSSDPEDPTFAFSFAGTALFIVGLHPGASRKARQFSWPTIVFNPHQQFRDIRARGGWDRFISSVRKRDVKLQGAINPNLADHGVVSEAKQYSGRAVEENWKCPFHK